MKRTDIRQLAADPRFISGIYNYCDRWCDRCRLSHRCLNYAMEQEMADQDSRGRGAGSTELEERLHHIFQTTLAVVREEAARRGIDLNDPEFRASLDARQRHARRREARKGPLARAAMNYVQSVRKWVGQAEPLFQSKGVELAAQVQLDIGRPGADAKEISEALEVIRWYHLFIHVKLARAVGSQAEEELESDEAMRSFPKDSDGSAKVALIAIDRSLAAWIELRQHFPEETDTLLDFLVQLTRLRASTETLFPAARAFVRPGFDTETDEAVSGCEP